MSHQGLHEVVGFVQNKQPVVVKLGVSPYNLAAIWSI